MENSTSDGFDDWYHISNAMPNTYVLDENRVDASATCEKTISADSMILNLSTELMLQVLNSLPTSELLHSRLVCKRWNDLIKSEESILGKFTYTVKNNLCSIDAFQTSAQTQWRNLRFVGINLEKELFGHPDIFRKFSLNVCIKLRSLTFTECDLPTGRFFELLAFCKKLKRLHIKRSETIFKPDMGIIHWSFCLKYVKSILAQLNTLSIVQKNLSEESLMGITYDMRKLVNLNISSEDDLLPVYAIGNILRNNAESLSFLTLRGRVSPKTCTETILFPKDLTEMKSLQILNLLGLQLVGSHSDMLEFFLEKCPSLKGLRISCSHLNITTLQYAADGLDRLELINCTFDEDCFNHNNLQALRSLIIQSTSSLFTGTQNSIKYILSIPKARLETLKLGMSYDGNVYLNILNKTNYPDLKVFTYNGSIASIGLGIANIIKNFAEQLTSLSIIDCAQVTECDFEGLKDMTNLRNLNLAGTSVGNGIVHSITSLCSLESVNLSKTKVTCDGLREILEATNQKLTRLRSVKIYGESSKISTLEFQDVQQLAPRVQVDYSQL